MTDEETCAQLYRDLCDASMRKDANALAAVLADDYTLAHMTGMRQSKRAYIAAVGDGTLNYYSTEHDSIDVKVAPGGETATIRGCSRVNAAVFGGGCHINENLDGLRVELSSATREIVHSIRDNTRVVKELGGKLDSIDGNTRRIAASSAITAHCRAFSIAI